MTKQRVSGEGMRVRAYPVLADAVEAGVRYGWRRAYKYISTPSEDDIREAITQAVLNEICEAFSFDDEERA